MTANDRVAAVLGVVGGTGVVAFVAGASALAAAHAGLWGGLAVAGLTVTVVAATGLFALSLHDDTPDRRRP